MPSTPSFESPKVTSIAAVSVMSRSMMRILGRALTPHHARFIQQRGAGRIQHFMEARSCCCCPHSLDVGPSIFPRGGGDLYAIRCSRIHAVDVIVREPQPALMRVILRFALHGFHREMARLTSVP